MTRHSGSFHADAGAHTPRDARAPADDAGLVARAQAGDRRAFEILLGQHVDEALRAAFAILGSEADARDATRDAFVAAWRAVRRLREPDRFDPLLTRILVERCRRAGRRRRVTVHEIAPRDTGEPATGAGQARSAPGPGREAAADAPAPLDAIERGFDCLGRDDRTILVLHHLLHHSVHEIAGDLRLPVGTARSVLSDARRHLDRAVAREAQPAREAPSVREATAARAAPTDDALEAALARLAGRIRAPGLGDEIMTAVAGASQARRPLLGWPTSLVPRRPCLRPAWVLATTGLLAGTLAAMLFARAWYVLVPQVPRHPADLATTGIQTLGSDGTAFSQAVADPSGMVWAYGAGVLARLDPASGAARTWTVSDDAAFGPGIIAPAVDGGVWMTAPDGRIRWFDGGRFRDVVPGPPGIVAAMVEAPDRLLWTATDAGVFAWDGSRWLAPPAGRPSRAASAVAVDATGGIWVGNVAEPDPGAWGDPGDPTGDTRFLGAGVSRFDGTTWENHDWIGPHRLALHGRVRAIVPAPDDLVWVATDLGLVFYNGLGWTTVDTSDLGFTAPTGVAVLPDGTAWAVAIPTQASVSISRSGGVAVARFDGHGWTRFGPSAGLPASDDVSATEATPGAAVAAVCPAGDDVVVATAVGLFRPAGEGWARAWPPALAPVGARDVLATAPDEAWAIDAAGIYRWSGGRWTLDDGPSSPVSSAMSVAGPPTLARAADGTLVALTWAGVAVRRAGRWEVVRPGAFLAMALDASDTVWVTTQGVWAPGMLDSFTLAAPDANGTELRVDGGLVEGGLAVGGDGSVWAGSVSTWGGWVGPGREGGLLRYRAGAWEILSDTAAQPLAAAEPVAAAVAAPGGTAWTGGPASDIVTAPDGAVWTVWPPIVDSWTGAVLVSGHVSRYDATGWTWYRGTDGLPAFTRGAIAFGRDGAAWLATDRGVVHFDGTRWSTLHEEMSFGPAVSVAPDGAVLVSGPSGIQRIAPPPSAAAPPAGPTAAPPSPAATPGATPTPRPAPPGPGVTRRPATLVPSGVETVTAAGKAFTALAADASGAVWGYGNGVLVRLDPASGTGRTWTHADDAAFGDVASIAAPARDGGVWLAGGDATVRWFDGERFRDTVPEPPGGLGLLAEAPDGSLWASSAGALVRWDGSAWRAAPAGRPDGSVTALAVDDGGGVWVGAATAGDDESGPRGTGVARYDGTRWTTWSNAALGILDDGPVGPIAAAGSTVWVSGSEWSASAAWFDGRTWHDPGPLSATPAAAAVVPDGTSWVVGSYGQSSVAAGRYDGRTWRQYLLPGAWSEPIGVAATPEGGFVGTRDGIYAFRDDGWALAWPPVGGRWGDVACCAEPAARLLAVARDEVWAPEGAWRSGSGGWTAEAWPAPGARDLARAADGTLIAATADGVAVRRDGSWELVWKGEAQGIAIARDGTVWFGDNTYPTTLGRVRGIRLADATSGDLLPPTPDPALSYVTSVAAGTDGSIWVAMSEFRDDPNGGGDPAAEMSGGLLRFRDGAWELLEVAPAPDLSRRRVGNIAMAPNGDVWVAWEGGPREAQHPLAAAVGRFDGRRWTVYGVADGLPAGLGVAGVAVAPDGAAWLATDRGLVRFDGARWSVRVPGAFGPSISIAPDGTVFVAGPSGIERLVAGD